MVKWFAYKDGASEWQRKLGSAERQALEMCRCLSSLHKGTGARLQGLKMAEMNGKQQISQVVGPSSVQFATRTGNQSEKVSRRQIMEVLCHDGEV